MRGSRIRAAADASPWLRTVGFLLAKEFRQIARDRVMPFQILAIPLIQLLVLANAATFEIRSSQLYVVDESRGPASRALARDFIVSEHFELAGTSAAMVPADRAMLAGEVDAILRIPRDFEANVRPAGPEPARVQLLVSGEVGAAAGIVGNYARQIVAGYAAAGAPPAEATLAGADHARAGPIRIRSRGWFNEALEYEQHMVPGILVVLVTVIGTLLTAMNIVREKEIGTLEQLNATPLRRSEFLAGKLLPFWILALVELGFGLLLARAVFDLPMRGSLTLLFATGGIYLVVALGVGLWISTLARTQQQAMFVTYFFVMTNLFMSGLFTPVSSMPGWAQAAAELVPLKHFIDISRAVLIKGAGVEAIGVPVAVLAAMGAAVFTVALRQYSKTAS